MDAEDDDDDEKTEELTPVVEPGSLGTWPVPAPVPEEQPEDQRQDSHPSVQETGARTKKTSVVISLAPPAAAVPDVVPTVSKPTFDPEPPRPTSVDVVERPSSGGCVKSEVRISVGPVSSPGGVAALPRPRMARALGPSFDIDDEQEKAAALAEALGVATKQRYLVQVAMTEF